MQIYMLITNRCNLNCKMCIRGKNYGNDIDFQTLKESSLIDDISEDTLVITGGEPTLHKDFVQIVKHICKYAKNVAVTTNGIFDYYIDDLKEEKNLIVQVSLDGYKDKHDAIRGEGAYEKTINTLRKLDSNGVRYSIASVVNKKNKEFIKDLINELKNFTNMSYWRVSYEMPFGNADFENMMTAQEWNDLVDYILKEAEFRVNIQKIFPFDIYDKYMSENNINKNISNRCYNCGSGRDKIYIYPDFNVYSCTCLTDFCIGNLKKSNLNQILCGEEIKSFSNYKIDEDVPCRECTYYALCNGGCIGMSYHLFGKLGKGDIRCPILRSYYEEKTILL